MRRREPPRLVRSDSYGFTQDALAHRPAESVGTDHVDLDVEQVDENEPRSDLVEQRSLVVEVD